MRRTEWIKQQIDPTLLSVSGCTIEEHSCLFTLESQIGRDAWLDFHQKLAGGHCVGPTSVLWSLQLPMFSRVLL